ncbi:hypothetical protein SteCoe_15280 [Stentor coeruleus]|uniref:ELMO domain-containing protein n=1 Tax=Stentor coeruleus TaxID=5963 RepID=A0A1R2C3X9_9CILI|nr:hypothetical protein SteCoe_15280 [Stentor coeruleus]
MEFFLKDSSSKCKISESELTINNKSDAQDLHKSKEGEIESDALEEILLRIKDDSDERTKISEENRMRLNQNRAATVPKSIIKNPERNSIKRATVTINNSQSPLPTKNIITEDIQDESINMYDSDIILKKTAVNGQVRSFQYFIDALKNSVFIRENYWIQKKFRKFLLCFSKTIELTARKDQNLTKIIDLGKNAYDNSSQFHKDLLFTYFFYHYNELQFIEKEYVWRKLGFSYGNKNEISQKGILLTLLHLIYLHDFKPNLLQLLYKINSITEDSKNNNNRIIRPLKKLMENSIGNLQRSCCNSYINKHPDDDEIIIFFEYHTGVVSIWAENYEKNQVFPAENLLRGTNRKIRFWVTKGKECK